MHALITDIDRELPPRKTKGDEWKVCWSNQSIHKYIIADALSFESFFSSL